jgi:lysophospholipase L1-like esterase/chitodextrinase
VTAAAIQGLSQPDETSLEEFAFQAQKYCLLAKFSSAQADIILQGRSRTNLSAGMDGENILLGTRIMAGNFYIFWLNYRDATISLAVFDMIGGRSRILALPGFSFIGLPQIIEENGSLRALVFLGNRSDNDDIFYFEPETNLLLPLTRTPVSEKNFSLLEKAGQLEIETSSLWTQYRYRFDRRLRESVLLEEKHFPSGQKSGVQAPNFASDNTYIGFGDSITWGQIEGQQRLDLCYLTQLQAILAPTYGPWYFINLGIPGQSTYDGAQQVDQELSEHPALYFLLMLGVNDVWRNTFSLASSLENLEYIVDAALAHGMRVIISTLTPRKDRFSLYEFYWDHLRALSSGILDMAKAKNVASIDTLAAFMNTNPPDGWKALLENIIPEVSKGNHPNGEGHRIIASFFAAAWVDNELPVPRITVGKSEIYWQYPVTFSGAGSYDPDGSIIDYSWDFANGDLRQGREVTYIFQSFGAITIKLTVTDNQGATASASKTIQVQPLHPVINTDLNEVFWQETVVFSGANSACADGAIKKYDWDFADGEKASGIQVSHRFANSSAYGDLPVKLTVTNNKNAAATATKIIKVKPRPFPVINADKEEILWQDTVAFDGSQSLLLPGFTAKYSWDFGDGEYAEGMQVSHKFANANAFGDKPVKLTIIDNKNVSVSATKIIKVKALYTAHTTFEKRKIRTILYNRWGYFVSWTANVKNTQAGYNIVSYKIFRSNVGISGDYSEIGQADTARSNYTDMSIDQTSGKEYQYAVCPVDAQGHYSPVDNF